MEEKKKLLLDEFSNNVAGLKAFNQCISLGNVLNDQKNRLICIDVNNHLKVFNGEIIEDENSLKNMLPVSGIVTYFSTEKDSAVKYPFLAVASGYHIFIYKFLKGIKKIPIPDEIPNSVEQYIYDLYAMGEIDSKQCLEKLEKFAEKYMKKREDENYEDIIGKVEDEKILDHKNESLSNMTQELFNIDDDDAKIKFIEKNSNYQIKIYNYVTILSSIAKDDDLDLEADSLLIVGTENCSLFVINPSENKIIGKGKLPGVPFLINTRGGYNSNNHKIIIADRGCNIYILKKTEITKTIIVSQPIMNLLSSDKSIYVGTIGKYYIGMKYGGTQEFCIEQPNIITSMEIADRGNEILILIGTKDAELRIYSNKKLCFILKIGDNIFGMKFGTLGLRKECIIMCTYGGALLVKYFNPDMKASIQKIDEENKKYNENIKIDVPKKPPIFRDFVQREKESKSEIQKKFITDLIKIKYKAMDTYVKILKKGNAPQNFSNSSNLKISASLEGLGPNFKLNIIFNNSGKKPIYGAVLTLDFNRKIYSFKNEHIQLSVIMPNVPVNYSLPFRNISETGSSGNIKLLVLGKNEIIPLIQTNIKVPVSELDIL